MQTIEDMDNGMKFNRPDLKKWRANQDMISIVMDNSNMNANSNRHGSQNRIEEEEEFMDASIPSGDQSSKRSVFAQQMA